MHENNGTQDNSWTWNSTELLYHNISLLLEREKQENPRNHISQKLAQSPEKFIEDNQEAT